MTRHQPHIAARIADVEPGPNGGATLHLVVSVSARRHRLDAEGSVRIELTPHEVEALVLRAGFERLDMAADPEAPANEEAE